MINEVLHLNRPQQISIINDPVSEINIWGRATGKSFIVGEEMQQDIRLLPRGVIAITGQSYGQIYTRTLPSALKYLEKVGYIKDKDFVINRKPPKTFLSPYEKIIKHDNTISFSNGTTFLMLSQNNEGSARGPNLDREIVDEALTLKKDRYDQEVSPANRGNEDYFGFLSKSPVRRHHGFRYVSSMPYLQAQKWLLKYADYYEHEAGIPLFDIWNRIVKLQLQLMEANKQKDIKRFQEIWNECSRLKKKIIPFVSREGTLFTLANAFDNIKNLGLSYIAREYEKQTLLTFMIEILNWVVDKVEDCYYYIDPVKHIYYDALNDSYIRDFAENKEYDYSQLENPGCIADLDCDTNQALQVTPDWGASINLFSVSQERNFNFVTKIIEPVECIINEFFVKPDESSGVVIIDLVNQFCDYYSKHSKKKIVYYRDRYGDHRQPNAKKSQSYNDQAIEQFKKRGWSVETHVHPGMEPPHHDKYILWANILKGDDSRFPNVIFNGRSCKYTLISMNNTQVRENRNGKFEKDKSSERKKSVLPEEATHFGDAVDKFVWSKYGHALKGKSTFVSPRL